MRPVVLADCAARPQALLHDVGDVVPGLLELVEAHRAGGWHRRVRELFAPSDRASTCWRGCAGTA